MLTDEIFIYSSKCIQYKSHSHYDFLLLQKFQNKISERKSKWKNVNQACHNFCVKAHRMKIVPTLLKFW